MENFAKCLTAKLIFGIFSDTYLRFFILKVYQTSRVLELLHMSHYVVAMVTKMTYILFFTLFFQWLNCFGSFSVAGVPFKAVLNEGEDH